MSTTQQLHGQWWAATDPSRAVYGVLTLDEEVEPRLDLGSQLLDYHSGDFVTVHGSSGGRSVSMFGAYVTAERGIVLNGNDHRRQTIEGSGVVVGPNHLSGKGIPAFAEAVIELDYLTFWTGEFDPVVSHPPGGGISFTVPDPPPRTAAYGDVQLTISGSSSYSGRSHFTRADMSLPGRFKTVLCVATAEPVSVDDHLDISRRLSDLVTIAMHRPAGVRSIEFHEAAGSTGAGDRSEWWSADDLPAENTTLDEGRRRRINFRLSDVDDVGELLARWHDLHTSAFYGVASVVAQLRETTTFYETRLLGVCGALEALHRGLYPVPKKVDYRARCAALAAIPPAAARAHVVPDIDEWAGHVTKARNHLAHGDEPGARTVPQDVWYGLHERTVALLVLVVLTKLGVPENVQMHSLNHGALRSAANQI